MPYFVKKQSTNYPSDQAYTLRDDSNYYDLWEAKLMTNELNSIYWSYRISTACVRGINICKKNIRKHNYAIYTRNIEAC